MERKPYTVTDKAGPRVAGQRVTPGETLMLTENQAFAELRFGNIVPTEEAEEAKAKAKAKA